MRRALISVAAKEGLLELGRALSASGVEMIATGSTASVLSAAGFAVTPVESLTAFPESFDGRVKTLHPAIHGAILADRARHQDEMARLDIKPIDLVVVGLYPFAQRLAAGAVDPDLIEEIDIGGVALIRAAAKNHAAVAVVTSPAQYPEVIAAISEGGFTAEQRRDLAGKAFAHVAVYDLQIATWMSGDEFRGSAYQRISALRYGENPHQSAAIYRDLMNSEPRSASLAEASLLHGKAMSYNNYVDADAALRMVADFPDQPCVAIIKHTNPCGVAIASTIDAAHAAAHACDPTSAFGGVIAANRTVNSQMARQVADAFTEVILAPAFDADALEILRSKPSLRVIAVEPSIAQWSTREISGGALVQTVDRIGDQPWRLACGPAVTDPNDLADLQFAWRAVRGVKSNAILLARGGASVGIGMGQVNRVDSARLAVARAGDRTVGAVAASDAFFPFPDGVEVLANAGVRLLVQPGGSVRDDEVLAAAEAAGMSVYLTGERHFSH